MKNLENVGTILIVAIAGLIGAGLVIEGYRRGTTALEPPKAMDAAVPGSAEESEAVRTTGKTGSLPIRQASGAAIRPPMTPEDEAAVAAPKQRRLSVLQIGDSHTAADYFTGELRQVLQARYGDGGPGYVAAGRPYPAVRTMALAIATSPGWTYQALQKTADASEFSLSGFNAAARGPGETMTFSLPRPLELEEIQIEAVKQPGGGSFEVLLDGVVKQTVDLSGDETGPSVFRIVPESAAALVRTVTLSTSKPGPVIVSSVAFKNKNAGLTYSNVGFIGATIHIVNKYEPRLLADGLHRLNPNVVVLAFGSNEGFNSGLDVDQYAEGYERAVHAVRAALPAAAIILVGPPAGEYIPSHCYGSQRSAAVCRAASAGADERKPVLGRFRLFPSRGCVWRTPRNLERVRKAQEDVAARYGSVYWNWASIMPETCGAHTWAMQAPPLMAKDHLHLTQAGYRKSADEFAKILIPILDNIRAHANVVSNN